MPIDDDLDKSALAAEITEEAERSVQDTLAQSGLVGLVSHLPFVGPAVHEMLTVLALRRVYERMQAMLTEMGLRLRKLGKEKIDREWFRGAEFQTLFFEATQQLHVTHEAQKIKMLGVSLANSGATEFKDEDRKELFLQLVRYLSPHHIAVLRSLVPEVERVGPPAVIAGFPKEYLEKELWRRRPNVQGFGTDGLILQMLAAHGLVEETLKPAVREPRLWAAMSQWQVEKAVKDLIKELQESPTRYFSISKLGMDFLNFVGLETKEQGKNKSTRP
jgi:hypothetical protein